MFSNLRVGTPIYVLSKQEPKVSIGEVQSVGAPVPQFGTTYTAGYLQPPKMLVDIKVKVGDEVIDLQKLPADQTIADFGTNGMVVSETRESILTEIENMRKSSQGVLDSVDYHRQMVNKCLQLTEELSPQAKAEAEQKRDIDTLKSQMANIEGMLSELLNKKSKED